MKKNDSKNTGTKKKSKKNNNVMFGIGCVVLGLLVILIFFLVNKDQIFTNLKETDFFGNVFGATPQVIENHEITQKNQKEEIPLKNDSVTITIENENSRKNNEEKIDIQNENTESPQQNLNSTNDDLSETALEQKNVQNKNESPKIEENQEKSKKQNVEQRAPQNETRKDEQVKQIVQNIDLQLCFLEIDGDGLVYRKMIKRKVPKSDSPLTNAIKLLLKGPDPLQSTEKNCMSVIPKGTNLLSAKVQDGVAYLNFNDALEFNQDGVVGRNYSLEQIVFTATSFSTVKSVQILIDGKKQDYLGSEGTWIGSPLSRENF